MLLPTLAVPQLGSAVPQGEARPLGSQPRPQLLALAAPNVAHITAFRPIPVQALARQTTDADDLVKAARKASPWGRLTATRRIVLRL